MIDLHCHILPGVDDGSAQMEISLDMAALAAAAEIGTIVATPHCTTRDQRKNYRSPELDAAFAALHFLKSIHPKNPATASRIIPSTGR